MSNPAQKLSATLWEQRRMLLSVARLPFSVTDVEAGFLLGFTADEIGSLTSLGLLTALGNPPPAAPKHYAVAHIEACGADTKWLHKARKAVRLHRAQKNARYRAKKETAQTTTAI